MFVKRPGKPGTKRIPPTVVIIDADAETATPIAEWLSQRPERPEVTMVNSVRAAQRFLETEAVDWLFIRTLAWDEYQRIAPGLLHPPGRVVFLSGRGARGAETLDRLLDAHLKPPFQPMQLLRIWNRLSAPTYQPPPLDFFFLPTGGSYAIVRYGDLREVRRMGARLHVETRHGGYKTAGSLTGFQARLPIPLTLVDPGWLVNEGYRTFSTSLPSSLKSGN